jgi:hypothetical protein
MTRRKPAKPDAPKPRTWKDEEGRKMKSSGVAASNLGLRAGYIPAEASEIRRCRKPRISLKGTDSKSHFAPFDNLREESSAKRKYCAILRRFNAETCGAER